MIPAQFGPPGRRGGTAPGDGLLQKESSPAHVGRGKRPHGCRWTCRAGRRGHLCVFAFEALASLVARRTRTLLSHSAPRRIAWLELSHPLSCIVRRELPVHRL